MLNVIKHFCLRNDRFFCSDYISEPFWMQPLVTYVVYLQLFSFLNVICFKFRNDFEWKQHCFLDFNQFYQLLKCRKLIGIIYYGYGIWFELRYEVNNLFWFGNSFRLKFKSPHLILSTNSFLLRNYCDIYKLWFIV